MLYAGLAVLGLVLLTGGGLYGYREYLRSKPAPIWVPIALRVDMPLKEQESLAGKIEEKLRDDELLRQIVIDAKLREGFGVATEDDAVEELKRRMFVKAGRADAPHGGTVPSINVGVDGTGREKKVLGDAAMRMVKDVWLMLGVDPETGKPMNAPDTPSVEF